MAGRVRNNMAYTFGENAGNVKVARGFGNKKPKITPEQWINQVTSAIKRVDEKSQDFAVAIKIRAQKVFQNSFKYNGFYTEPFGKWAEITENTWKKRQQHIRQHGMDKGIARVTAKYDLSGKTPKLIEGSEKTIGAKTKREKVLQEFGFLKKALKINEGERTERGFTNSVYVDRSEVLRNPIHPMARGAWALWHNTPYTGQTYGSRSGNVPFKQRQFMGHSSYIVGPTGFIESNERKYLFDEVFIDPTKI